MDYLEVVRLFERPMLDNNSIRHLVFNLQDKFDQHFKRLWNDHEFHLLERFMHMHKPCGLYAQLILVQEDMRNEQEEEEISFVRGIPSTKTERKIHTIDFGSVRNRKK